MSSFQPALPVQISTGVDRLAFSESGGHPGLMERLLGTLILLIRATG